MRRLGPVLTLAVALAVAGVGLGACSSSDKATVPPVTTASTSTSSTTTPTVPIEPATVPTSVGGTTTTVPDFFPTFTVSPPSPVECNSPTMIELTWTTAPGVKSVELTIDGRHAASFPGGPQDHLQYFACDGKKHSYAISAKVGTTTDTQILDVVSKMLS